MFAFGAFTLVLGPLSDRFGKVKVITIAALGTSVFSILDGFAPNMPVLVAFRAMNGAFGAGVFPVMMAIVGQSFDCVREKSDGFGCTVFGKPVEDIWKDWCIRTSSFPVASRCV